MAGHVYIWPGYILPYSIYTRRAQAELRACKHVILPFTCFPVVCAGLHGCMRYVFRNVSDVLWCTLKTCDVTAVKVTRV